MCQQEQYKTENLSSEEQAQTLFGNQFVWIPCTVEEYKKCNVWNGTTQTGTTLQNGNWETKTNIVEKIQIKNMEDFILEDMKQGQAI